MKQNTNGEVLPPRKEMERAFLVKDQSYDGVLFKQHYGMNRICILIPCHRVIGKDGMLTGYGGGLWRKRLLLELETSVLKLKGLFGKLRRN